MKRIVVVGNGQLPHVAHELLEVSDVVCRFNIPPIHHRPFGSKTTTMYYANSSKQIGDSIRSGEIAADPFFQNSSVIRFTYDLAIVNSFMRRPNFFSRLKGRRLDWSDEFTAMATSLGKRCEFVPPSLYFRAAEILKIDVKKRDYYPSSGFIAVLQMLEEHLADEAIIQLIGFGFSGWKRHKWSEEREYIVGLCERKKIEIY